MALEIGKTYTIEGIGKVKIEKATAKGKAKSAVQLSTGKRVNFGDPNMKNAPGTERGDNYCSRSGSLNERGFNANTLSREDWNCKGKTSKDSCDKYDQVMKGFDEGNLKDKYGKVVTSRKDAEAIAYSESGKM
ncbi:hypothetical protein NVP1071A_29 [Vibrio phage 1.071.A._10N.286.46.A12]|nr:hypothetical protein NVP1071A_29 [Vibrio phage 1.071.A._10N.286.46.A12]